MNQPPERPSHKRMSTHVNRGLAWIGIASSLVGILDLLALLIILNTWVTQEQYGVATLVISRWEREITAEELRARLQSPPQSA